MSVLVAGAPLACGSDDDDDTSSGTAGTTSQGGSSGSGGKTNTAGKSSSGGSVAGDSTGAGGDEALAGAGGAAAAVKTRLRVVHASANAPTVDIYPTGSATAAVEGLAYGEASDFIEVDAGTIAFDLRPAGVEASTDPAFTTDDIALETSKAAWRAQGAG
jgi:hypothetical protein